jgi:hypothetical protein
LGKLKTSVNSDAIVAAWSKTVNGELAAARNCWNSDLMASKSSEYDGRIKANAAVGNYARGSDEYQFFAQGKERR